ncbi:hypothetical protein ABEB36_013079 [Hypothenemus hampei]|uniref:Uncharacterized protein n=1 Tax=Hypothenemus hampei TaxID=57062 RepID=A0ABD1E718_HYPHA
MACFFRKYAHKGHLQNYEIVEKNVENNIRRVLKREKIATPVSSFILLSGKGVLEGLLRIPCDKTSPGTDDLPLSNFYVGEESFALVLQELQQKITEVCRNVTSTFWTPCTFVHFRDMQRLYYRPHNVNVDFAADIVTAGTILYSFVPDR